MGSIEKVMRIAERAYRGALDEAIDEVCLRALQALPGVLVLMQRMKRVIHRKDGYLYYEEVEIDGIPSFRVTARLVQDSILVEAKEVKNGERRKKE